MSRLNDKVNTRIDDIFIEHLLRHTRGKYFFLSTKTSSGKWQDHAFKRDELNIPQFIKEHKGKDIYFCPHGFSAPYRRKEYAVLPKLLWADMDEADPYTCKYRPTIAIESSPGRYVGLWLTYDQVTEELNHRLTIAIEADKGGWDLTQVLRLPGTYNHKYNNAPLVHILWKDGPIYEVSELDRKLPKLKVPTRRPPIKGSRKVSRMTPREIAEEYLLRGRLFREALTKCNGTQDRSGLHWKLACELHDRGVEPGEAFVFLKEASFNKHDDDEAVWKMIDKIWSK